MLTKNMPSNWWKWASLNLSLRKPSSLHFLKEGLQTQLLSGSTNIQVMLTSMKNLGSLG